jgi:hypothetical protein
LVPLDDLPPATGFRQYLRANRLPYYSPAEHAATYPSPPDLPLLQLPDVLRRLEEDESPGVIITGAGGVGKTRMGMELGLHARRQGWVVLCAVGHLRPETLDQFAEDFATAADQRVLLLIDYVEQMSEFSKLVDRIVSLNATYGYRIRFAGNCRTTYYYSVVVGAIPDHLLVDLTPHATGPACEWIESHRAAVVDHILRHAGLPPDQAHRAICHDTPVLAVFMAYLRELGRDEDLAQLLELQDFALWVSRRVQMTFDQSGVSRDLATLVAMFPMFCSVCNKLPNAQMRTLFDQLAADRWIERDQPTGTGAEIWVTVHDVLADQILLAYCRTIPATVQEFVDELLDRAAEMGTLWPVLFTLQRVAGQPPLLGVDWHGLLLRKTGENPGVWKSVRDLLIGTSLLQPTQVVELLSQRSDLWEGAETSVPFQCRLATLATRLRPKDGGEIPEPARSTLALWFRKVAPHADETDYPLTWGLRLCPEDIREFALAWLSRHGETFDAHYPLVAWLQSGQGHQSVNKYIVRWANRFSRHPNLSFLIRAWCEAGGPLTSISNTVLAWVAEHGQKEAAQFVYPAWLKGGGRLTAVVDQQGTTIGEHILAWVAEHGQKEVAEFVYRAWLGAGGGLTDDTPHGTAIRNAVLAWVAVHGQKEEATFVYQAWLNAGGGLTEKDPQGTTIGGRILAWVAEHGQKEVAQFVYQAWLNAGGGLTEKNPQGTTIGGRILAWVAEHGQKEHAGFVYRAWLDAGDDITPIEDSVQQWVHVNRDQEKTVYLMKALTKEKLLPLQMIQDILFWCRKFTSNTDVLWRFTGLGSKLFTASLADDVLTTAEILIASRAKEPVADPVTRGQVATILSFLIDAKGMQERSFRERVDRLLAAWLRNPSAFGSDPPAHVNIQQYPYAERVVTLIGAGVLDPTTDDPALRRFVAWLNTWQPDRRASLRELADLLKRRHGPTSPWSELKVPPS